MRRDEKLGVPLAVILCLIVALRFLTPATFWFRPLAFDVQDGAVGAEIVVTYDRVIRRDFIGEWFVSVRREGKSGWEAYCTTPITRQDYRDDSVLPDPVTLEWLSWTEPRCHKLPAGTYEVAAHWRINPDSWLFDRTIHRVDTFTLIEVPQ